MSPSVVLARRSGNIAQLAALLRNAGWLLSDKRVERIWVREGLKVLKKQRKRGRLCSMTDRVSDCDQSSAITFGPTTSWKTGPMTEGRTGCSMLSTTHQRLAIRINRKLKAFDGSTFSPTTAYCSACLATSGPIMGLSLWPGGAGLDRGCRRENSLHRARQPWENGYIESFNARLRDELLDGEIFYTLKEAQIIVESWRRHYNTVRAHASLGYRPLAPEVFVPTLLAWPAGATPISSAGHAPASAEANAKLTFHFDHSVGPDHRG